MPGPKVLLAAMSLGFGGAETHVVTLAEALLKREYRVQVVSHGGPLVADLERVGIEHFSLPLHSRNPLRLTSAVRHFRELIIRQQVDLIHAHARIPAWVADTARRSACPELPLVTTYHGVYSARAPWRWFTRWGDSVIAVSPDVACHLKTNLKLRGIPLTFIPNGIDIERFQPAPDDSRVREELGISPGEPVIVHMSRLTDEFADVALALQGAVRLLNDDFPRIRAVIVGTGNRHQEVEQGAQETNSQLGREAVILMGGTRDPAPYLSLASVVIAVARSALEAMALAKPVVIAGEGGFRGLLTPENTSTLKTHNFTARGSSEAVTAENLALSTRRVLDDPQSAQKMGTFGRSIVEGEYDLKNVVDRIEEVYRGVESLGNSG